MSILSVTSYEMNGQWEGHPPFTQDYHLLLLITGGELIYKIDGVVHHLSKGHVLLLPKGTRREGYSINQLPHSKIAVRFHDMKELHELPVLAVPNTFVYPSIQFPFWQERMTKLLRHWSEKQPFYAMICQSILTELLVTFNNEHNTAEQQIKPYLRTVREYITSHFTTPIDIALLANLAGKKKSYLITSFRSHFGESPIAYMHQLRIAEAERLLIFTELSIERIAERLGYCDASYFNRMFRARLGFSPTVYRLQHK